MSERETKEFTTPGNHKVIINTYLTGREKSSLDAMTVAALKMTPPSGPNEQAKMGEVSGAFFAEVEQKTMAFMVVSLDGDATNPLERLLDLPSTEYDAVKAEVDKVTNPTSRGNSA